MILLACQLIFFLVEGHLKALVMLNEDEITAIFTRLRALVDGCQLSVSSPEGFRAFPAAILGYKSARDELSSSLDIMVKALEAADAIRVDIKMAGDTISGIGEEDPQFNTLSGMILKKGRELGAAKKTLLTLETNLREAQKNEERALAVIESIMAPKVNFADKNKGEGGGSHSTKQAHSGPQTTPAKDASNHSKKSPDAVTPAATGTGGSDRILSDSESGPTNKLNVSARFHVPLPLAPLSSVPVSSLGSIVRRYSLEPEVLTAAGLSNEVATQLATSQCKVSYLGPTNYSNLAGKCTLSWSRAIIPKFLLPSCLTCLMLSFLATIRNMCGFRRQYHQTWQPSSCRAVGW